MSSSSTFPTASPTPSDNGNNNDLPTGILGSSGGAPLILVFLGAGLLVGAVFALLILRRFYPRRFRVGRGDPLGAGYNRNEANLDEKPLLWDVQLEIQGASFEKDMYGDTKWDTLTPMSARFIPDNRIPPPAPLPLITLDSLSDGSETPRRHFSGLRRHLPFVRSSTPQHAAEELHHDNDSQSTFESPTGGYSRTGVLQVAVAIGMPRPPSEQRFGARAAEPELCLGLTEVPWDERVVAKAAAAS